MTKIELIILQFIFAGEVCSVNFLLFYYFDFTAKFYAFLIVRQTFFYELLECDLLERLVLTLVDDST